MGVEIERKFLVCGEVPLRDGVVMKQGYLCREPERTVRVRLEGTRAVLTVKGKPSGISRDEFEYEIPLDDGRALLAMCHEGVVEKTRYRTEVGEHVWEVDVFGGENIGLVVAEIELAAEDEVFELPPWVGEEVSGDARYSNSSLSGFPWKEWRGEPTIR